MVSYTRDLDWSKFMFETWEMKATFTAPRRCAPPPRPEVCMAQVTQNPSAGSSCQLCELPLPSDHVCRLCAHRKPARQAAETYLTKYLLVHRIVQHFDTCARHTVAPDKQRSAQGCRFAGKDSGCVRPGAPPRGNMHMGVLRSPRAGPSREGPCHCHLGSPELHTHSLAQRPVGGLSLTKRHEMSCVQTW